MDEIKKNEPTQIGENGQTNEKENKIDENNNKIITEQIDQKEEPNNQKEKEKEENININLNEKKGEESLLLKDKDLIVTIKNNNYKDFIHKGKYVDFRIRDEKPWKIGYVSDVLDDIYIVEDIKENKTCQIKKDDANKISYFRKYSSPDNEENFYKRRDTEEKLIGRLNLLEKLTESEQNNLFNNPNPWDIYYLLHSKFFLGLDSAMKVNTGKYNYLYGTEEEEENEGAEVSFKIIMSILLFLSKYYKYITENIDDFIYFSQKIKNTELEDLQLLNKNCAFFSFFDESFDLLNKIFANIKYCLYWYNIFEDQLKYIIPISLDDEKENGKIKRKEENVNKYPQYESEKEKEKEKENELIENKEIKLKKVCLKKAYGLTTTFTTDGVKVKAIYVSYFIDYFAAIKGFSYMAQIIYKNKNFDLNLFNEFLLKFNCAKVLTSSYNKILIEERKKIFE